MITERRFAYDYSIRIFPFYEGRMSAKRLIPEKELKACYGLLFADYPDVVTVRQLQTMLGISRHAAYDLLGEGGNRSPQTGQRLQDSQNQRHPLSADQCTRGGFCRARPAK